MNSDLSEQHSSTSKLFSWPATPDDWHQYRLSSDQIEFFHASGYLAGIPVLNEEQVDVLRRDLKELIDPNHPGNDLFYEFHSNESTDPATVLFHALGAWRISPAFHDLLWNPAFLMPSSQLLGGAVRFWHDQLFVKPPHHGGVVAWHQDYSYWTRTQPMAHLSCWIGLDDSTIENGCVHYVPGSHRWNLLPVTGLANDMNSIESVLTDAQRAEFKPVAIELKTGECSFHHPLMVHGSYENKSDRPRRGTIINVFRDGVQSGSNDPLLEGVPAIGSGEKIEGQFFPLLFDPACVRTASDSERST
ncbi:MAG TPA: phytanoyl-CoA dioxygenase family protein [Pyrinomonadaceae bacterium]|nr:phytanoyl-CoA dioxygenase family protein [Pyrinomonadaceae bacterium]